MNLNLGNLLANGKTLVGLSGGPMRYRLSKAPSPPKFLATRNPFMPTESAAKTPVAATPTDKSDRSDKSDKSDVAAPRAVASEAGQKLARESSSARGVSWLSSWGKKLRPRSRRERSPGSVKAGAQQGEPSL